MQAKKRAKPVHFGKHQPPKTEKQHTAEKVDIPKPQMPERTEEPTEIQKSAGIEAQKTSEKPQEEEPSASSLQTAVHSPETDAVAEEEKQKDVQHEQEENVAAVDTIDETVQKTAAVAVENVNEEEPANNDGSPSVLTPAGVQVPPAESSPLTAPVEPEPFSKEALEKEAGGKHFILYFFLIALVAFLVGCGFIAGLTVMHKNISLPAISFAGLTRIAATPTKIPIPTEKQTPTPTVSLSAYYIQILNGSGITGAAAKLQTELTSAGFTVKTVGNADQSNYTKTQVVAKNSVDKTYLNKLETTLQQWYVTEPITVLPQAAGASQSADVTITIGSSTR